MIVHLAQLMLLELIMLQHAHVKSDIMIWVLEFAVLVITHVLLV